MTLIYLFLFFFSFLAFEDSSDQKSTLLDDLYPINLVYTSAAMKVKNKSIPFYIGVDNKAKLPHSSRSPFLDTLPPPPPFLR